MCGVDAKTEDFTYDELLQLRLAGTEHHIPLFTEVLEVYAGAGPMVLELKTSPRKYELCEHTYALLKGYEGDVCIESFDPRIVGWWKKHAPEYLRGQLAQPMEFYEEQSKPLAFMLANCLTNFMARPHFVAYKLGVSRQAVSKWENGTSFPSTSNLLSLAKLYNIPAEELIPQTNTK
jgi:glycerophosphoryl diester phosphodiesterase